VGVTGLEPVVRDLTDLRGWVLLCKAWRLHRLALTALVSALAWAAVPAGPVAVPARDGVESVLWPLVPVLVAAALPATMAAAYRDGELTAARSRTQLRGAAFLLSLSLSLLPSVVATRFDLVVVWRNTGFLFGLALFAVAVQPEAAAWLPICGLPMWMWLLGTNIGGDVESWAVLLHPAQSRVALMASVVVLALGLAAYWAIRAPWRIVGPVDA
jgi:hypothetical protein